MTGAMGAGTFKPVYDDAAEDWERSYAMWCHLGPLLAGIVMVATNGVGFFVPGLVALILWLVKRGDSPFVDDHGREAVNFQISIILLWFVAVAVGVLACGVGVLVTMPAWIALALIGMILGVVAAKDGRFFRYPACIRFLS